MLLRRRAHLGCPWCADADAFCWCVVRLSLGGQSGCTRRRALLWARWRRMRLGSLAIRPATGRDVSLCGVSRSRVLGPALHPRASRSLTTALLVTTILRKHHNNGAGAAAEEAARHDRSSAHPHLTSPALTPRCRAASPVFQLQEHPPTARAKDWRCRTRDRRAQVRRYDFTAHSFVVHPPPHRSFAAGLLPARASLSSFSPLPAYLQVRQRRQEQWH